MNYEELSEREKRIYDQVYALEYHKHSNAYYAVREAEKSIYDLRDELKKRR